MKNDFTFKISGAFLLLTCMLNGQDLIISEVADPADVYAGRFVELYNAGTEAIDFGTATFFLARQSNGGTSWGDVQLTGTLNVGEAYVIGGTGFEEANGFPPDLLSGIIIGNGNDAYFLYKDGNHSSGTLIDIYGEIDTDGTGQPWEYTDSHAVRNETVVLGSTVWTASEWLIESAGIADCTPGTHNGSQGPPPPGVYQLLVKNDTLGLGEPVPVSILVGELSTADDIISYQFTLRFDTTAIAFDHLTMEGTLSEGGTIEFNESPIGTLSIGYMNTEAMIGEGTLLILNFNALQPDTSSLIISDAYLNNEPVSNLQDGMLIVKSLEPPVGILAFNDTLFRYTDTLEITAAFTSSMDSGQPVFIDMSGAINITDAAMNRLSDTLYGFSYAIAKSEGDVDINFSRGRDIWGNDLVTIPYGRNTFTVMPFRPGDVDDDGLILAYDAALTLQYSVGLDPLSEDPAPWDDWRDSTANVDGSGDITANDAAMILRYSAGIIQSFDPGEKKSIGWADVDIKVEGNELVFYSYGELIGLNVSIDETQNVLKDPVVRSNSFLEAHHIDPNSYKVGLCTTEAVPDGTPILKIPFESGGMLDIELRINNQLKGMNVDLMTGIRPSDKDRFLLYPNPASMYVMLEWHGGELVQGWKFEMINPLGEIVLHGELDREKMRLNSDEFGGAGTYFLKVLDSGGGTVRIDKIVVL